MPKRFYVTDEDYAKLKRLTDRYQPKTDSERIRIIMEKGEESMPSRLEVDYEEIRRIVRSELKQVKGY